MLDCFLIEYGKDQMETKTNKSGFARINIRWFLVYGLGLAFELSRGCSDDCTKYKFCLHTKIYLIFLLISFNVPVSGWIKRKV